MSCCALEGQYLWKWKGKEAWPCIGFVGCVGFVGFVSGRTMHSNVF